MRETEFTVFFPFCGLGAGALGFLQARAALLGRDARFRSLGGIDNDPAACADFSTLTGSPALCADIATMTPDELRAFVGEAAPDVIFSSPPCKGNSGLLNKKTSETERYQDMNRLVVRWLELVFATWSEPPRLLLIENVPGILSRGRNLLREVRRLLRAHGYVLHEGTHDCGELGGLAQHRRRYLLVGRQAERVPPLLYKPPKMRVRGCGEVIGLLPLPEAPEAGPMHRMPRLSWLNWIRLALIPAGGDWRDLPGVVAEHQQRRDVFGRYRVERWDQPTQCVSGDGTNGPYGVADPRVPDAPTGLAPERRTHKGVLGVRAWTAPSGTVTGESWPTNGSFAVADPRLTPLLPSLADNPNRHTNKYAVGKWEEPAATVIGATRPGSGAPAVADPRLDVKTAFDHGYRILRWDEPSFTVHGKSHPGCGAYSVADPRLRRPAHAGAYGVLHWRQASGTVTGAADVDNGRWAIADPRVPDAPPELLGDLKRPPKQIPLIVADDGTWHRPLTTLELAGLQGLPAVVAGVALVLHGSNVSRWRERIGNAVPVATAKAIATQMLVTLVHAAENSFTLSGTSDVWVDRAAPAWELHA